MHLLLAGGVRPLPQSRSPLNRPPSFGAGSTIAQGGVKVAPGDFRDSKPDIGRGFAQMFAHIKQDHTTELLTGNVREELSEVIRAALDRDSTGNFWLNS